MVEAYRVAVAIVADATDGVLAIDRVIQSLDRLEEAQSRSKIGFNDMLASMRGAQRVASALASDMERVARSADRAASSMRRGGGGGGNGWGGGGTYYPGAEDGRSSSSRSYPLALTDQSSRNSVAPYAPRRNEPDWSFLGGGDDGGGGGGNGGRSGAGGGGHRLHGLHELGGYSMLGGIGTLGFVGNASGRGFTTDDLLHVLASDRRISPAQVHGAYEAAYDATKSAPGTRLNTNLEALIDLTNVTGSLSEAQVALPAFAKMSARLQALDREHGGSGDQAYAAAKAMDIMGGMIDEQIDPVTGHVTRSINPALMQSRLDKMTRVAVATNDKVSPNDYLNFAKQARTAGMTLTDDYIYERLPAMLQTIGGDRVGTAMMSMSQLFQGGKLSGKSYDALAEIGLAAQDHVTRERDPLTGRMRTVHHRAGVYDLDVMRHDPLAWVEKAQDRMEKAGIHGTENQVTALMKASQRSTVAGVLGDLLKDMPAILRDQERIRNTDISKIDSSAASHLNQMTASWDRFMTVTGNANTSNAVALMDKVTGGLNALSDFEHRHPNMARDLTLVGGGLGALGVGLGAAFLAISPFLALKGLAGRAAGAAGAEGAAGAAEGASASILSRMGSVGGGLGRILAPIGLAYQAYQIHQTVRDDEAKMWEDARKNPREMRQAQWAYDHTFGIVGHNFRDTQSPQVSAPPQAPIQVTAQVLLDKRVLAEAMTEYSVQQARQGTRASGTAPDTVQHVQLPGRALGR